MTAIVNVQMFGKQEVSIYDPLKDEIIQSFVFTMAEARDTAEYVIKAYDIDDVVIIGPKLFTKKVGRIIQDLYTYTYQKEINISYK